MIRAAVISSGVEGIESYFLSNAKVNYEVVEVTKNFNPDFSDIDLLIVPNGSDHIAMSKIKDKIRKFLDQGKSLFCFDGWFTDWIPGNQWVMSNEKKTIDIRYNIKTDKYNLFDGVDLNELIFYHGISGWWACGYIENAKNADVILEDTWHRPIIVLDENTTNGTILLTASAPLGDKEAIPVDNEASCSALSKLYHNILDLILKKKEHENHRTLI